VKHLRRPSDTHEQTASPWREVPYGGIAYVPNASLALLEGSASDRTHLAQAFQHAFETFGVLRLQQTGLPASTVSALDKSMRKFFSLPLERKQSFGYGASKHIVPLGGTYPKGRRYHVQASFNDTARQTHVVNEWFIYRSVSPSVEWDARANDSYYSGSRGSLFFKAQGSSDYTFPAEVPGMQEAAEQYYGEMEVLATRVMRAFALSLNVSEDFFVEKSRRGAEWPVTIAHYPDTSGVAVPPGVMRINPHWDRDLFALVVMPPSQERSEANAMQVLTDPDGRGADGRSRDVQWRSAVLQEDEVLVNLGELMARYSNGRYKHVIHQVPNSDHGSRVTFMAYVRPNVDEIVEPIRGPEEDPRYSALPVGLVSSYDNPKAATLYEHCAREKLRLAQGMYGSAGEQRAVRFPGRASAVEVPGCPKIV